MKSIIAFNFLLLLTVVGAQAQSGSSCVSCHGDEEIFGEDGPQMVQALEADIHFELGLSCHSCHGGNPDPSLSEDMDAAMNERFKSNPYIGVPDRTEIPAFCGNCHSDPEYMKRFRPDVRVDIEQEYWTSAHGKALKKGDTAVATCTDCHGIHGIQQASDPQSPVYAANVAETCSHCHSDPELMAGRTTPSGRPLPINQYELWKVSVHADSLLEKGDLFAPTCNDCHGNHGAAPPGLDSVSYVCGQCHGREASLFRKSVKHDGFLTHNEFIEGEGSDACEVCHEMPAEFQDLPPFQSFSECASCHGNHGVRRPNVAMLSPLPQTPCAFCHEPTEDDLEVAEDSEIYLEERNKLLQQGMEQGLEGVALFDWLVGQAMAVEFHLNLGGPVETGTSLKADFARLFEKFRIGESYYTYTDPVSGEEVQRSVIRCNSCHSSENDESPAVQMAMTLLDRTRELTANTAAAERLLARAKRGGIETRSAQIEIDKAIDAQIELQVLIHGFGAGDENEFVEKQQEGLEHAKAGMAAGEEALGELQFRRKGLAISLIFIAFVLVALWMKIREIG